jgi:hypothetical protein
MAVAKRNLPIVILTAAAVAACVGCAAPVEPQLKSARSHQVPVDLENLALFLKHGRAPLYPFSTPHCPYYDRRAKMWLGAGLANPGDYGGPTAPIPAGSELPPPETVMPETVTPE